MSVTSYASMVQINEWCFDDSNTAHVSMSNLQLEERTMGVTLCLLRTGLFRIKHAPWPHQRERVCPHCVRELVAMGETVPKWMEGL